MITFHKRRFFWLFSSLSAVQFNSLSHCKELATKLGKGKE